MLSSQSLFLTLEHDVNSLDEFCGQMDSLPRSGSTPSVAEPAASSTSSVAEPASSSSTPSVAELALALGEMRLTEGTSSTSDTRESETQEVLNMHVTPLLSKAPRTSNVADLVSTDSGRRQVPFLAERPTRGQQ